MDYSKIEKLIDKKKMKINAVFKYLELSHQGWYDKMKKHTMTVRELEKISEFFGVSPSYFLEESKNMVNESAATCNSGEIISELREDLKYFRERCKNMEFEIAELRQELRQIITKQR